MYDDADDKDLIIVDEAMHGGIARWLPTLVVLTAVAGFVSLAWYAYHAGTQSVKDEDLLVVEADTSPIKEKPLDPGGMQFPDQDKTVFDTFSAKQAQPPKVERVLPTPEEPAVGFIKEDVRTVPPEAAKALAPAKPEQVIAPDAKVSEEGVAIKMPRSEEAPKPTASETPKPSDTKPAPKLVKDVPAASSEAQTYIAKTEIAKTETPAPKTAAPAAGGTVKAQLGAYRSQEEAQAAWAKLLKKYPELLSGRERVIVKADLGERGVYYRLRVAGFTNALDAKGFCDKLSTAGQACMLASDK
jgi:cell division protein FtsN